MVPETYRGKSIKDQTWVIGSLFKTPVSGLLFSPSENNVKLNPSTFYIVQEHGTLREVDPETIGLCSGFDDVKEQNIYTDDIIQLDRDGQDPMVFICRFGDVEFKIGDADVKSRGFYFELTDNGMKCYLHDIENAPITIIGNTVDNPELLKKKPVLELL